MRVISAEKNEGVSFLETDQFSLFSFSKNVTFQFPENDMFNPPKKNILISQKWHAWSPEKTNFNLPNIEVL